MRRIEAASKEGDAPAPIHWLKHGFMLRHPSPQPHLGLKAANPDFRI
jgi:hypothetical protein